MIKKTAKEFIRKVLWTLHLDITQNLRYDRQTIAVMKKVLRTDSVCIDVGCHKGEILDLILDYAPEGKHFAFEPLPVFYKNLQEKYQNNANIQIFDIALWKEKGSTTFQYVVNAPAYSGLKQREYKEAPEIQEITVQTDCLDEVIPEGVKPNFIKIDVEGGEFGVLEGAKKILSLYQPIVIFESGIGASDYYGTQPELLYHLLKQAGLEVSLMEFFLKGMPPFTEAGFIEQYKLKLNYYFIAYPSVPKNF